MHSYKLHLVIIIFDFFVLTLGSTLGNNIYVFENDHYYDESRWGSPDQIDRERMGFGKNTIYKEENGRIIAISSGSTNFAALYRDVTENFTKKYHAVDDETMKKYEVPILKFPDEPPKE